jgi:hypothetical protein
MGLRHGAQLAVIGGRTPSRQLKRSQSTPPTPRRSPIQHLLEQPHRYDYSMQPNNNDTGREAIQPERPGSGSSPRRPRRPRGARCSSPTTTTAPTQDASPQDAPPQGPPSTAVAIRRVNAPPANTAPLTMNAPPTISVPPFNLGPDLAEWRGLDSHLQSQREDHLWFTFWVSGRSFRIRRSILMRVSGLFLRSSNVGQSAPREMTLTDWPSIAIYCYVELASGATYEGFTNLLGDYPAGTPAALIAQYEHMVLATIYVFAIAMDDHFTQSVAMRYIVQASSIQRHDGLAYFPGSNAVNIIYNGTQECNPMRTWLLETYLFHRKDPWQQNHGAFHGLFKQDYTKAFLNSRSLFQSHFRAGPCGNTQPNGFPGGF